MWVADMDFPVAEPVLRALRERIDHGLFGYPDVHPKPTTISELQQVLVDRMWRLYHWQIRPEELLMLPGVIVGLNLTCQAVAKPGDAILVQTPVYPPFLYTPKNAGMQRQDAELTHREDGHYEVDWQTFEAAITEQTKMFILCHPHNPAGRVYHQDELETIAEICLRKGVVICSEEIHCDLVST